MAHSRVFMLDHACLTRRRDIARRGERAAPVAGGIGNESHGAIQPLPASC